MVREGRRERIWVDCSESAVACLCIINPHLFWLQKHVAAAGGSQYKLIHATGRHISSAYIFDICATKKQTFKRNNQMQELICLWETSSVLTCIISYLKNVLLNLNIDDNQFYTCFLERPLTDES